MCIKDTVYTPQCSVVVWMSCKLHHPFAAVVAGPTGSGKSEWVLRLIDNANEMTEPPPSRIWYCYGEFQPTFNNYPRIRFREGLPDMSDAVFDGSESNFRRSHVGDQSTGRKRVYENFASSQRQRSISHSKLVRQKQKRTISLNTHYLMLFKNPRDATQFATLASQMYPNA